MIRTEEQIPLSVLVEQAVRLSRRMATVRPYFGPIALYYGLVKFGCCTRKLAREILELLLLDLDYYVMLTHAEYEYIEMAIDDQCYGFDLEYVASLICASTTQFKVRA